MMVCTGCALLCEDIEKYDGEVRDACRIGTAHIRNRQQINPMVDRKVVDMDSAIKGALDILSHAKRPVFVGFGNSITETQQTGIRLAEKIDASIKTFHTGIIENILNNRVKTCTLSDVRDYADVIVFWECDPMNTHPRLLSKYAYYPRGEKRQHGWEEDRTAITIDLRYSHTASICREVHKIHPGLDADFIDALIDGLHNKVPKTTYDKKQILKLAGTLKKAEFGVIFAGTGMTTPQDAIIRLMDELNEVSNFHILPMTPGYNLRSIAAQLHGRADSGIDMHEADCILCLGFDLLNSLPVHEINGKMIVIDPNDTISSRYADVVIPCAAGGVDCAGSAVRMDGVEVDLPRIMESERISDASIMNQLLEAM